MVATGALVKIHNHLPESRRLNNAKNLSERSEFIFGEHFLLTFFCD